MGGGAGRLVVAGALCALTMACSSGDGGSEAPAATLATGRATTSVTTTTTTAPPSTSTTAASTLVGVEREVEVAYLRSWDVYADAMVELDPSRLEGAYVGPALEVRRNQVVNLARLRTPALMRVEHDYEIVVLNTNDAFVFEEYVNHSVLLNGTTLQPIEPDPNAVVRREYVLRKGPDGWRVAHINAVS